VISPPSKQATTAQVSTFHLLNYDPDRELAKGPFVRVAETPPNQHSCESTYLRTKCAFPNQPDVPTMIEA
jgi:hypothetical protein